LDPRFEPQWVDVRQTQADAIMPGTLEIIQELGQKSGFFLDLKVSG
jgi:hypothetical protein